MRVAHNRRTDTVYISLTDYDDGDVARWYLLAEHDVRGIFTFDFDKKGCLLGIEVRYATQGLPGDFLAEAEVVKRS